MSLSLRPKNVELTLEHPDQGKTDWVLTIQGFDSKALRDQIKRIGADRAENEHDKKLTPLESLNSSEEGEARIAAAAIVGWNEAFANADESIGSYSADKALELMRELYWVRDAVAAKLRQRAEFFR